MAQSPETAAGEPERRASRLAPRALVILVLWSALLAATLELLARGGQKFVLGDVIRMSRDVVWMAPLGQLMLFVPVAALLYGFARMRRRQVGFRAAVGMFAFLALLGVLITPNFVHPLAAAVLAAGVAFQLSRILEHRADGFLRLVRRTTPALALLLALPAAGIAAGRAITERRALAVLPDAPAGAPNVILLIWDTVRASSMSLYGHDRPTTPNLDALARAGVVFERAIAPTPWTLPSHASMFTGFLPHQLSAGWVTPLDDEHATLAEVFRDAGYVTGGFAANVLYADWEHGLSRGFIRYEGYPINIGQVFLSTSLGRRIAKGRHGWEQGLIPRILGYRQFVGRRLGESVDEEFLEWVDERGARPFFAFLNYFDAHLPYEPPAPFDTLFEPARPRTTVLQRAREFFEREGMWDGISELELGAELAAYEASIAYLDHRLGILYDELERRDLMDNTLIILTSDHGEEFLEHGDHEHGSNLYMEQLHVPLVVLQPGQVPGGVRVDEPVSLRDVAATVAELSGVPGGNVFPGTSFAAHWSGDAGQEADTWSEPVLSELVPGLTREREMHSMIVDRLHYIRNLDGHGELYDYLSDPRESNDLADEPGGRDAMQRWDTTLEKLLECDAFDCCCRIPPGLLPEGR